MDTFVLFAMLVSAAAALAVFGAYNSTPEDVLVAVNVTPLVRVWRWARRAVAKVRGGCEH